MFCKYKTSKREALLFREVLRLGLSRRVITGAWKPELGWKSQNPLFPKRNLALTSHPGAALKRWRQAERCLHHIVVGSFFYSWVNLRSLGQICVPGADDRSQTVGAVQLTEHLPLLCPDS